MSEKDLARRTDAQVYFDGVDISESLRKYLISMTFTDEEADETDDLQIKIEDREGVWMTKWLNVAVQAAASGPPTIDISPDDWAVGDKVIANGLPQYSSYGTGTPGTAVTNYSGSITRLNLKSGVPYPIHVGYLGWFAIDQVTKETTDSSSNDIPGSSTIKGLSIQALIIRKNWHGDGKDKILDCGLFELDSVNADGPPATITIKGTSLPFNSQIRQTKKSKAWEAYTLSQIANEIATANGMTCMYESTVDPYYARVEQITMSDIAFLKELCNNAGISLKATNKIVVLFDQESYEAKPAVFTIEKNSEIKKSSSYTKYKLSTGAADKEYASCRVSYIDPVTKNMIEGIAYIEDYNPKDKNNQVLEITAKVNSIGEAQALAKKMLRLKNKYEYTANFTLPGNPDLVAGVTVMLVGWGAFDGKYIINQAKHSIGKSGYTTQLKLRHILEGY